MLSMAVVYASDASAQSAIDGYYDLVMNNTQGPLNGGIGLYAGLSADEVACTPPYTTEDSFEVYRLSASYLPTTGMFNTVYNLIFNLNLILAGVDASSGMSAAGKAQLTGEALFNRAWLYFYLVNLYGGVPLVVTVDFTVNTTLPRASVDSVYGQIVADLQQAILLLPAEYPSFPGYPGPRTRPNRAAAQALLARVWLYRGQWAAAETTATNVIADPLYQLEPDLDSVFLSTSREAIWQLLPLKTGSATGDANAYLSPALSGHPFYILTAQLLGSIDPGDQRALHWTDSVVYKGQVVVCPYKYKMTTNDTGAVREYEMVLRLAEQYLIRAEARAQQGELAGAIADVNTIRARAGLPPTTALTQTDVLTAVAQERRVELFSEWGHRWLDLKRTGQADIVLQTRMGWDQHDLLYPIPAAELLADPAVAQNPGY